MANDQKRAQKDPAREVIWQMEHKPVIAAMLKILAETLPPQLTFHSLDHTKDVLHQAMVFAVEDGVSKREQELLAIAAAYHDSGFLQCIEGHEEVSAKYAEKALRDDGSYSEGEIALVVRMILDTRLQPSGNGLHQDPHTTLSRYLLDADLSNFGRDDFFERLDAHCQELGQGKPCLLNKTLTLMQQHNWLTMAAAKYRQAKKLENIQKLQQMIDKNGCVK